MESQVIGLGKWNTVTLNGTLAGSWKGQYKKTANINGYGGAKNPNLRSFQACKTEPDPVVAPFLKHK